MAVATTVVLDPIAVDAVAVDAGAVKRPALVVGSLSTAEDGTYQALISDLQSSRQVDKQLVDRLVDNGEFQPFE